VQLYCPAIYMSIHGYGAAVRIHQFLRLYAHILTNLTRKQYYTHEECNILNTTVLRSSLDRTRPERRREERDKREGLATLHWRDLGAEGPDQVPCARGGGWERNEWSSGRGEHERDDWKGKTYPPGLQMAHLNRPVMRFIETQYQSSQRENQCSSIS
jgi:hypothetical protein